MTYSLGVNDIFTRSKHIIRSFVFSSLSRSFVNRLTLYYFEADAEGVFVLVPVGAEEFEAADLGGGAHMTADAGTDIVVADAYQSDGVAGIVGQAREIDTLWQVVIARHDFVGDGQVIVDELVHASLDLLLLLSRGFMVEQEAHLALLALHMGVIAALASEHADHGLIEQMFRRMGRWKFVLVVLVE